MFHVTSVVLLSDVRSCYIFQLHHTINLRWQFLDRATFISVNDMLLTFRNVCQHLQYKKQLSIMNKVIKRTHCHQTLNNFADYKCLNYGSVFFENQNGGFFPCLSTILAIGAPMGYIARCILGHFPYLDFQVLLHIPVCC
jgi:hypothetical protein